MIVVSSMAVTLFWGGWLRPFPNIAALGFLDLFLGIALVRAEGPDFPLLSISGSAPAGPDIGTIS